MTRQSRRLTRATVSFAPSFTLRHRRDRLPMESPGSPRAKKIVRPRLIIRHNCDKTSHRCGHAECGRHHQLTAPKKSDFFVPPAPQWAF